MLKQHTSITRLLGNLAWALCISTAALAGDDESRASADEFAKLRTAVVRLAVDQVDAALSAVAGSTQAVAREWTQANHQIPRAAGRSVEYWNGRYTASGKTIQFQTWPGALSPEPAYQSDNPAWYAYRGEPLDADTLRQLEVFAKLTSAVRAAYRSFPYAWSYVTTAQDMMLLFPFLTLEEAINNQVPTEQVFYQQAGFTQRAPGWTPPYLDLAGAGLMVTVSTPAYDGDTLLGVVSHDITLQQLSLAILQRVARDAGGTAWLVDASGLALAVSDPALASELEEVNTKAKAAVLHYRLTDPSAGPSNEDIVVSSTAWINALTSVFLKAAQENPQAGILVLGKDPKSIYAGRLSVTGWWLIWSPQ